MNCKSKKPSAVRDILNVRGILYVISTIPSNHIKTALQGRKIPKEFFVSPLLQHVVHSYIMLALVYRPIPVISNGYASDWKNAINWKIACKTYCCAVEQWRWNLTHWHAGSKNKGCCCYCYRRVERRLATVSIHLGTTLLLLRPNKTNKRTVIFQTSSYRKYLWSMMLLF